MKFISALVCACLLSIVAVPNAFAVADGTFKSPEQIAAEIAGGTDDRGPEVSCRQLQLALQELALDEDFVGPIRPVVRSVRLILRQDAPGELKFGCFKCVLRKFAKKHIPPGQQKVCGIHDLCEVGAPLSASDSACAGEICGSTPSCCQTEWSQQCVDQVDAVCSQPCNPVVTTTTVAPPTTTQPPGTTTTIEGTTTLPPGTTTTIEGTTTLPPVTTTTIVGGTTTLPPVTTTTVVGGTTTLPPVTTTTVPGTTTLPPGTTTTVPGTTTLPPVTTTTVPGTTTLPPGTTTTVAPSTTTSTTSTTVVAAFDCPIEAELTLLAQTRQECANNGDCDFGTCDTGIGRCVTQTELDTGYTGIAHDSDITDNVALIGNLNCPNADGGATCGQCTVAGLDPASGNCRCSGLGDNNQIRCDQPFQPDPDCPNGVTCNCYLGPPLALSAGGTPACVVNRFSQDISGTTNVDTGDSALSVKLRSQVFLGILNQLPCPYCTNDVTPGDGVRDGDCVEGRNAGDKCDVDGINRSFPAPGGDGHSLDCFPSTANVSGAGLIINLDQTTGSSSLASTIPCKEDANNQPIDVCQCGICSLDNSIPCSANSPCPAGAGTCGRRDGDEPLPNNCNGACADAGGGEGICSGGPSDLTCDGVVKANGEGFLPCLNNADCDPNNIGIDGGACALSKQRECFLPTIVATGDPDPTDPISVATFCVPFTANAGINATAGLPGPGRVVSEGHTVTSCASGVYTAGVGCP